MLGSQVIKQKCLIMFLKSRLLNDVGGMEGIKFDVGFINLWSMIICNLISFFCLTFFSNNGICDCLVG